MKILLTAFEPFGGETMNPALEAVKRIADHVGDTEVIRLTVPTVFYKSIAAVSAAIETEKPDAVLCIGQAEGRCELTPERVAINLDDTVPSMSVHVIASGIEAAIQAIAECEYDIAAVEGMLLSLKTGVGKQRRK